MKFFRQILIAFLFFIPHVFAQNNIDSQKEISLKPETLGAKTILEDLISRRYSQELSALVKKDQFNLSAILDLRELNPNEIKNTDNEPAEEPLTDLTLGKLDPENLVKNLASTEQQTLAIESFLKNYRIKTVSMTVGLNDNLGAETKAEVEKWMNERINEEFGSAGKGRVIITKIPVKTDIRPKPQSLIEWLEQFQNIAAQVVLVLGFILAVLIWKIMSKPISINTSGELNTQAQVNAQTQNKDSVNENKKSQDLTTQLSHGDIKTQTQEFDNIKNQILQVTPKILNEIDTIIRSWCQMGEDGYHRLACFAEVVGQEYGKLPIPVDAMSSVSKVFTKMMDLPAADKKNYLQKAYWDLLSVINLGAESLEKPFGYISQTNFKMMKEVLINQNLKMQTLVSLFMTADQRKDYLKGLSDESKIELLNSAAQLTEVDSMEFRTMDIDLKHKLKPQSSHKTVPLEMTLNKLAESMSKADQIKFLPFLDSESLFEFKQNFPSLAFIHEWPQPQLQILLSKTMADEIVAFLQIKPDMKEIILNNTPPFTSELVNDELSLNKLLADTELEIKLNAFSKRLEQLVTSRDIKLDEIFKEKSTPVTELKNSSHVA